MTVTVNVPSWVPQQYQSDVAVASAQWGVPPAILAATLSIESGFDPNAVSSAGAQGIAQFMPGTAASYGVNPWDPQSAINGCAHMLSDNYRQFGSWTLALAAYNGGPGAIHNGQASGETANYAQTVLSKAETSDPNVATATLTAADSSSAIADLYKKFTAAGGTDAGFNKLAADMNKNSINYSDPGVYGWKGSADDFKSYVTELTTATAGKTFGVAKTGNPFVATLNKVADATGLGAITEFVKFMSKLIGDITDPKKWMRLGLIVLGGVLAIGGVYFAMNGLNPPKGGGSKIVPIPV